MPKSSKQNCQQNPTKSLKNNCCHPIVTAMLRSSRDGLVIIDKEGIVLEINGVFTQLTQVDHSQIVNHPINELIHSEGTSEALLYGALQSLFKSETADVREIPFSDKILEIYSQGDDSPLDVCILSVRDITDQKLRDKKLAEYQLRANAAFELSFELIGILDTRGVLLDVNSAALEMIDAQRNDVVGSFFGKHHGGPTHLKPLNRFTII